MICYFISAFILSIVCIIVNAVTLAYLLCIGLCFILIDECEGGDRGDNHCFFITPHLYFSYLWRWMCEVLDGIRNR